MISHSKSLGASRPKVARVCIASVLLQLVAAFAIAQEVSPTDSTQLSLTKLLELAQQNVDLKKLNQSSLKQAQLRLSQVNAERWLSTFDLQVLSGVVPNVDANAAVAAKNASDFLFNLKSNDLENDFSFTGLGPFVQLEVKAIQPLYTWGKISGYEKMASENISLVGAQNQSRVDEIRYLTKKAFYNLLFSVEAINVLSEVQEKLQAAEDKLEELLIKNSKNVEEQDRLKIRVFASDVANRLLDARRGETLSRTALAELTGIRGDWKPIPEQLKPEPVDNLIKEEVIRTAISKKPSILQLDRLISIKKAEKQVARSDLFPSIFLAGELNYAYAPGRTDVKNPYLNDPFNRFGFGVALGFKQDLGLYRSLNKMEQLETEIYKNEAQRQQLIALTRLQTEEHYEKAANSIEGIQINEKGFRAARSWLTSTALSYNLGTASTKDVLESYAAYFKARLDLIKSIFELNMALAELSRAAGIEAVAGLNTPSPSL
ncbi:MAG: TolC family protein [Bdellovibrionota bacterium]